MTAPAKPPVVREWTGSTIRPSRWRARVYEHNVLVKTYLELLEKSRKQGRKQTVCEHGWSSLHPQPCPECAEQEGQRFE